MNRRSFMVRGAALSGIAWVGREAHAGNAARSPFDMIVVDRRFAAARAFALEVAVNLELVRHIDGDITQLWYDDLFHRWSRDDVRIAGCTLETAAVQLGHFARDRGYELDVGSASCGDEAVSGEVQPAALETECGSRVRLVRWTILPTGVGRWV